MNSNERTHENNKIEVKYQEQKEIMLKKYKANIDSFCNFHKMDLFVGWDMLKFNAKCLAHGATKEVIPGGGKINVSDLVKDYKVLEELEAQVK